MSRVAGSRSQLPLLPHSLHEKSIASAADAPVDESYERYYLFGGYVHVKYFALVKNIVLLIYLSWMMKNDLVQQQMECFRPTPDGLNYYREPCTRNICLWLHYIALAPGFLIQRSSICMWFMLVGLLSSSLMLCALHLRERARLHRTDLRPWIKYLMVTPGLIFELFVVFFCYYAIFLSVEWRVQPSSRMPTSYIVRAVVFAIILSSILLAQVVTHLMSVWYVCERQRDPMTIYHCGHPSPSDSVLEMLKHPLANARVPSQLNAMTIVGSGKQYLNDSHRMSDSANASFESAGYGRLRHVMLRGGGGTGNHSPEGEVQCVRESVDCTPRRPSPRVRQGQADLNASNSSDYQQIRCDQLLHLSRTMRGNQSSAAAHADYQDSQYLEVI